MTDRAVTSEAGVRVDHSVSVGREKGRSAQGEELQLEGSKKFGKFSPTAVVTSNRNIVYVSKCRRMHSQWFYYEEMVSVWGASYA